MTRCGWKTAKRVRVVFSLSFLFLVSLVFLDPWHIIPKQIPVYLTAIEFVPGLLKLIVAGGLAAMAGVCMIVLMTLLFGRIYCSTICPVGTIQDVTIHLAKKFDRRKRFKYGRRRSGCSILSFSFAFLQRSSAGACYWAISRAVQQLWKADDQLWTSFPALC